jgi:tetratricopeptide (TPR) repeat protein
MIAGPGPPGNRGNPGPRGARAAAAGPACLAGGTGGTLVLFGGTPSSGKEPTMIRSRHVTLLGLAALLACSVALSQATPQQISRASKLCNKAVRLLQSGDMEKARDSFNKALQEIPSYPNAHIGLGQIAMGEGDFETALSHFNQAKDGYHELGESLLDVEAKRYASAQREINQLQDSLQHIQTQSVSAGATSIDQSKMQNRIQQLQAIEPPNKETAAEPPGEIYFYIGNALFQLNRRAEALEAWETCRDKSPGFAMVYNNLALVYMQAGRLEAARESLAKAEELGFPVNPQFKQDLDKAIAKSRDAGAG